MQPRTYTLKEAVAILNRSGTVEESGRISRHIRHWTSMDLLFPEGQKHTGTGRSREYSAEEVRRAAVLVELAKWKVPMTVLANTFRNFDEDYDEEWEQAIADSVPVFLMVTWGTDFAIWKLTVGGPGLVVLDESQWKHPSPITKDGFDVPASAIVINLSRLLRWLRF